MSGTGTVMLIPWNTDAPIYHFPFVTIVLIVINTVVFFATLQSEAPEQWMRTGEMRDRRCTERRSTIHARFHGTRADGVTIRWRIRD